MYHYSFGKLRQLVFHTQEDYYRFLGYLAKADIEVVYEYNEETGSWGNAGRICFFTSRVPRNFGKITYREGRGGSMWYRINCNDFGSIGQIAGCDPLQSLVNTGDSDESKFSTVKSSFESPL